MALRVLTELIQIIRCGVVATLVGDLGECRADLYILKHGGFPVPADAMTSISR